jgi:hypothetical protein
VYVKVPAGLPEFIKVHVAPCFTGNREFVHDVAGAGSDVIRSVFGTVANGVAVLVAGEIHPAAITIKSP